MALREHLLGDGQSLAAGNDGGDTYGGISTAPEAATNAKRVNPDGTGTLIALQAIATANNAQQPAISMTYRVAEALTARLFALSNHAVGGQPIVQLSKGGRSGSYEAMTTRIAQAYAAAVTAGDTYRVSALAWWQGEADQSRSTTIEQYVASLATLRADLASDVLAICGQADPFPMVCGQTNSWPNQSTFPRIGQAQWLAHLQADGFTLAGPEYQHPYRIDTTHHTAVGYYWAGEIVGRALAVVLGGGSWNPVMPVPGAAVLTDTYIDIPHVVPVPPLVWDTTLVPAQPNYGFALHYTTTAITSAEIRPDGTTVRLNLSAPITDLGVILGYCSADRAGNLRDSETAVSKLDDAGAYAAVSGLPGHPLPNFAVQSFQTINGTPLPPGAPSGIYRAASAYVAETGGALRRLTPA